MSKKIKTMQNKLIILILAGTLCGAVEGSRQQREAVDRLLSKNSADNVNLDVLRQLNDKIGRDYQDGPLANITGLLIDMNEASETSCAVKMYAKYPDFVYQFKDTPLGGYVQDRHKRLLDSCPAFYEQKFTSIASELDGDIRLKRLLSFVSKLGDQTKRAAHDLGYMAFEDLVDTLKGPVFANHVRPILDQCQVVYERLRDVAPGRRVWGNLLYKWDELTKKWITNYAICNQLVGKHEGIAGAIHSRWTWLTNDGSPALGTFANYLEGLPEEVALRRDAEISDEFLIDQVIQFIEYRMRSSTDGIDWPKKSQARLERFEQLLGRLMGACKDMMYYFEPYLWVLDAGAQLDKSDGHLYASQLGAVKVMRVCGRLPSIDFKEAILQWNDQFSLFNNIKKNLASMTTLACSACQ